MYKSVMYIVNEIKGVTETLKTSSEINVVRDYKGDGKSFIAVSLSQPEETQAIIIAYNHRFEMQQIEIQGGQYKFWTKTSQVISIANNLFNRGIKTTLINFRGKNKTKVIIKPTDNFYSKINEFCGVDDKPTSRLSKEFKKSDNYQAPKLLRYEDFKEYRIEVPTEKELRLFNKFAGIYGLNPNEPTDLVSFRYYVKHPEYAQDFLEGNSFKCPHCGNLVRVNGHEEFIDGKFINTNETICDCCGEEFDIHDKKDILQMLGLTYEDETYTLAVK